MDKLKYIKITSIDGLTGEEEILAIKEIEKEGSHCPKCGELVLGNEDGICGDCV